MAESKTEKAVSEMFNHISKKYDLVNRMLSFGIDKRWRKMVNQLLPKRPNLRLLDLATGTGDQLLSLMQTGQFAYALGIDIAEDMICIGQNKIAHSPYADCIELKVASALSIPTPDQAFDCTTISFGIRNVEDPSLCLREMHRVLIPSGKALILEFSLPQNPLIKNLHLFYLRHLVPTIGGLVSGNQRAYRYLNTTIEHFPYGNAFVELMQSCGFVHVKALPLTLGVATLYIGEKS